MPSGGGASGVAARAPRGAVGGRREVSRPARSPGGRLPWPCPPRRAPTSPEGARHVPNAQDPSTPDPDRRASRRPAPRAVALVLLGIILLLSIGAYALVTAWLG